MQPQPPQHPRRPQRVSWVAFPPPGALRRAPGRPRRPYTGPPSYPAPPRWGFPRLAWRSPTSVPGAARGTADAGAVRSAARVATSLLGVTAVTAGIAALGELLRYGLLVAGLSGPVAPGLVLFSDTLVIAAGLVTIVFAVASLVLTVRWLLGARKLAAACSGRAPARSDVRALASVIVPGWNLVGPLAVTAELEHIARGHDPETAPRPSRALWTWWAAWLAGAALFALTFAWSYRDSIQAVADGVLLHAATDAVGAAVAALTARTVARLTAMLLPADAGALRYRRILSVGPDVPERTARAPRPANAAR